MTLVPPGARATYIDVDGTRVRVLRADADDPDGLLPILLIHGGGTDHAAVSWYTMFEPLSARRVVYGPDMPGFGHDDGLEPVGGPGQLADFIARVAAEIGLRRVVVMGVSMGGDVALNLALRHPDLVAALVLAAPTGLTPRHHRLVQFGWWLFGALPDPVLLPLVGFVNRFVEPAVSFMVRDIDEIPDEARAEYVREGRRHRPSIGYVRYHQAVFGPTRMRNNLLPQVPRISVPTLFVHGADDPVVSVRGSEVASRLMPDARLVVVPDCGHLAQLEAPDGFRDDVLAFLAEVGA